MKIRKFREDAAVKPVDEEENKRIPKPEPKPEPKEDEKVVEDFTFEKITESNGEEILNELKDLKKMIKRLEGKIDLLKY
jgi:hypothetical protein